MSIYCCHSVPPATPQTLVVTLVLLRLDYSNAVMVGLLAYLMRRLVCHECVSAVNSSTTPLWPHHRRADESHWLRVPERVQFKVAVLVYKTLQGLAPRYLGPLTRVADLPGRRSLRSANLNRLDVSFYDCRLLMAGHSMLPAHEYEIAYRITSPWPELWQPFVTDLRHSCFSNPIPSSGPSSGIPLRPL